MISVIKKAFGCIAVAILVFLTIKTLQLTPRWIEWEISILAVFLVAGAVLLKKNRFVGAILGIFMFIAAFIAWGITSPRNDNLDKLSQPIHQSIKGYWIEHGDPPDSIEQLDIELPLTRYGTFEYKIDEDGYVLQLGDYGMDGRLILWKCTLEKCEIWTDS